MPTNLTPLRLSLEKLLATADLMRGDLDSQVGARDTKLAKDPTFQEVRTTCKEQFNSHYQGWYTEAAAVVRQVLPERYDEFRMLYEGNAKRKTIDSTTYVLSDWVAGRRAATTPFGDKLFDDLVLSANQLRIQVEILRAAESRFDSKLHELDAIVRADIFDSEIDGARELRKAGFLRPAGVIGGVVLEAHLLQVSASHGIAVRKANPTIGDLNELLKKGEVYDLPTYRFVQRLGDIRNICGHKKEREPLPDEVTEMLDGVDKILKTIL